MVRLDLELVRRRLVRSRSEAADLIAQGRVQIDGQLVGKAAVPVSEKSTIEVLAGPRYVGRGGYKLAAVLEHFQIDVAGAHCLDVGASTGGFTDCLLQRGAALVTAVDVGMNQLDESLRRDSRVHFHEGVDLREVDPTAIGGPFAVVTVDVSFISICRLADALASFVSGLALVLVKPQFEVGRALIGRGVVHRSDDRTRALARAQACLADAGLDTVASMDSPLRGEHGNVETFLLVRP